MSSNALDTPWTEERTNDLIKRWDSGESAGEICNRFRCTRSAVIGKIHRLRQQGRITRVDAPRTPGDGVSSNKARARVKRERRTQAPTLRAVPRPPRAEPRPPRPAIDYSNAKPWTERRFGECAFPIGSGADALSCCAPTGGATYCGPCRGLMYRPVQPTPKQTRKLANYIARAA